MDSAEHGWILPGHERSDNGALIGDLLRHDNVCKTNRGAARAVAKVGTGLQPSISFRGMTWGDAPGWYGARRWCGKIIEPYGFFTLVRCLSPSKSVVGFAA